MIKHHFHKESIRFGDKILALDFPLIFFVLLLGVISFFAMYSNEQGKIGYFTQSHFYRFFVFFIVFSSKSSQDKRTNENNKSQRRFIFPLEIGTQVPNYITFHFYRE